MNSDIDTLYRQLIDKSWSLDSFIYWMHPFILTEHIRSQTENIYEYSVLKMYSSILFDPPWLCKIFIFVCIRFLYVFHVIFQGFFGIV